MSRSFVSTVYRGRVKKLEKLLDGKGLDKETYLALKNLLHETVKEVAEKMYYKAL